MSFKHVWPVEHGHRAQCFTSYSLKQPDIGGALPKVQRRERRLKKAKLTCLRYKATVEKGWDANPRLLPLSL